jgi:hypothetical protein
MPFEISSIFYGMTHAIPRTPIIPIANRETCTKSRPPDGQ